MVPGHLWWGFSLQCFSVQFSHSVVFDSLWSHEPQHTRPPSPSPTPRVHPNPCPLSRWCHPTISSSVVPFSSCPQSFPASGSFQMSQLFASYLIMKTLRSHHITTFMYNVDWPMKQTPITQVQWYLKKSLASPSLHTRDFGMHNGVLEYNDIRTTKTRRLLPQNLWSPIETMRHQVPFTVFSGYVGIP